MSSKFQGNPKCSNKLVKNGERESQYHDVFSDHKLKIARYRCKKCKYETSSTVKSLIGGSISGDLKRLQAELGAEHSFRESEKIFEQFSRNRRRINNHDRVKCTVESVGAAVEKLCHEEKEIVKAHPAEELI